jgi:hypothetical protein
VNVRSKLTELPLPNIEALPEFLWKEQIGVTIDGVLAKSDRDAHQSTQLS